MLIITRRIGETIYIGDDIKLIVLDISEAKEDVEIGINAPEHINIHARGSKRPNKVEEPRRPKIRTLRRRRVERDES